MLTLSPTSIAEARESLHHYKFYIDREKVQTKQMERGSLIHMCLLEPVKFEQEYTTLEVKNDFSQDELKEICKQEGLAVSGTKKALSERIRTIRPTFKTYDEVVEENPKKVISPIEWAKLMRLRESLKLQQSGQILPVCEVEKFCEVELEGVKLRFKPDAYVVTSKGGICFDLKTVQDCSPRGINRKITYDKWYLLAAIYCDALTALTGVPFDNFTWITIQESVFGVKDHQADFGMLEYGRQEYKELIKQIKQAHENNKFPLYGEGPIVQSLPEYMWSQLEVTDGI